MNYSDGKEEEDKREDRRELEVNMKESLILMCSSKLIQRSFFIVKK